MEYWTFQFHIPPIRHSLLWFASDSFVCPRAEIGKFLYIYIHFFYIFDFLTNIFDFLAIKHFLDKFVLEQWRSKWCSARCVHLCDVGNSMIELFPCCCYISVKFRVFQQCYINIIIIQQYFLFLMTIIKQIKQDESENWKTTKRYFNLRIKLRKGSNATLKKKVQRTIFFKYYTIF